MKCLQIKKVSVVDPVTNVEVKVIYSKATLTLCFSILLLMFAEETAKANTRIHSGQNFKWISV